MLYAILLLVVIHLLLWLIPFIDIKKQKIIVILSIIITVVMILTPPLDWVWNIKLPIINNTIDNFTIEFMSNSGLYSDLLTIIPSFETEILAVLKGVIKGVIVDIVLSLVYIITALVMFIIHVSKIKQKITTVTIGFICILFAGIIMILSPLAIMNELKMAVNDNVARKGEILTETYNYEKYDKFIGLINTLSINSPVPDLTNGLMNFFTFNNVNILKKELYKVDDYLLKLKDTGATIIYTDKSFDFRKTTKETFDFEIFKDLIVETFDSRWYKEASLSFANQIMTCFEERVAYDVGIDRSKVNLQFTAKEFNEQYDDLMDMLAFVVDNNLVNKTSNLSFSKLISLAGELGLSGISEVFDIAESPIINKINQYVKQSNAISKCVYACARLYDVMNDWLIKYKQTSLYYTITTFLTFREIIVIENI